MTKIARRDIRNEDKHQHFIAKLHREYSERASWQISYQRNQDPVSLILGYLAATHTPEQIIAELPDRTNEQTIACLDYARELSEFELAG